MHQDRDHQGRRYRREQVRDGPARRFERIREVELLFYAQLRNKQVIEHVPVGENRLTLVKHRCRKQVRRCGVAMLGSRAGGDAEVESLPASDILLIEVWEQ